MPARTVQCEFLIPAVRDSDRKPHQPVAWRLLVDEVRREFPAGHSGPETFYRGDALVPGEFQEKPGVPPVKDRSRRYVLAVTEDDVERLRALLRRAANTFDQKAIYLSTAGIVEFVAPGAADGCL